MSWPATFKARDITRALRAARAGGLPVSAVEITRDGMIRMIAGEPGSLPREAEAQHASGLVVARLKAISWGGSK